MNFISLAELRSLLDVPSDTPIRVLRNPHKGTLFASVGGQVVKVQQDLDTSGEVVYMYSDDAILDGCIINPDMDKNLVAVL